MKIRQIENSIKRLIIEDTIYKDTIDLIEKNEAILGYFLNDYVKLKYKTLTAKDKNELEPFVHKILSIILNSTNREVDMQTIVYNTFKSFQLIEKIIEYYQNIKEIVSLKSIVIELDKENFEQIEDLVLIEDKILRSFIDHSSQELIRKFSDKKVFDAYEFETISNLINHCYIEIFSIRINLRLTVNSYHTIYFFSELVKFLKNDQNSSKDILNKIFQISSNKLKNAEFIKNTETLESMVKLLNSNPKFDRDLLGRFVNYIYCLNIELVNDPEITAKVFEQFTKDPNLVKASSALIGKIFDKLDVNIELDFLKQDGNEFVSLIDKNLKEMGLDTNFGMICLEVIAQSIDDDDDIITSIEANEETFTESIMALFDLLKNYEKNFISEKVNSIKYKHIGYLTSIAYLRILIVRYCETIFGEKDIEIDNKLVDLINKILSDETFKTSNSLRMMALRILNKSIGSFYALKEFFEDNPNVKWRNLVNFGQPDVLIDTYLKSDGLGPKIEQIGSLIKCMKSRFKDEKKISEIKKMTETKDSNEILSICLATFNNYYLANTNKKIFDEGADLKLSEVFRDNVKDEKLKKCLSKIASNFDGIDWLKAKPDMQIDDLKLISNIFNCVSIIISQSNKKNSLCNLFFDDKGNLLKDFTLNKTNYWLCIPDDEEYELLNTLKDLKFVSYTDEEINKGVPFGNGFGLYKCSNECKYYYTVGACTRVTPNDVLKCSKGHLLMGKAYNQLHERPGHMKIPEANKFIQIRMQEVKNIAPKGYLKHLPDELNKNHTVRMIKPVTFRVLHFILHSTLYMMLVMDIYKENQIKKLLGLENDKEFQDAEKYLR